MNEKRNILVVEINAAQEKPSPIKIIHLRTRSEIKHNSDAFAVDWQLEGSSAFSENNFIARFHKNASGLTNGRERHSISFVHPRLKPNK
jgi:Na+-transporting NADH:ubiquinone oxidoreductase subunit NqrA